MVTIGSVHYAIKATGYYGLSSDTKPSGGVANGSVYVEMDTSTLYVFDGATESWIYWHQFGGDTPSNITFAYNQASNI